MLARPKRHTNTVLHRTDPVLLQLAVAEAKVHVLARIVNSDCRDHGCFAEMLIHWPYVEGCAGALLTHA